MTNLLLLIALARQDSEFEILRRREEARASYRTSPTGTYLHYCAHCHGEDGKGGGRLWTTELSPKPADLTATKLDEAALAKFIAEGSAASGRSNLCPPWGRTISPPDVERLARHVRSLDGKPAPDRPAPPASPATGARRPFPWGLVAVILVELALLGLLFLRRKKGDDAVPQDPAVRG